MGRFGYCLPCDADIPVARLAPSLVIQAWLLAVLTA
jgi:hypothetical protein